MLEFCRVVSCFGNLVAHIFFAAAIIALVVVLFVFAVVFAVLVDVAMA